MAWRYAEWVCIYNANADSMRPKAKRVLLEELNTAEQALTSSQRSRRGNNGDSQSSPLRATARDGIASTTSEPPTVDSGLQSHAQKYKSEFDALLAQARQTRLDKGPR